MSMHPVVTRTRHWCISIRKVKFSRSLCWCRPFRSDGVNSDTRSPRPPPPANRHRHVQRHGADRSAGSVGRISHNRTPRIAPPVRWNVARRLPARSFRPHAPSLARSRLLASCLRRPRSIHQTAYHTHRNYTPRTRCNTARTLAIPRSGPLQWSTPQSRRKQDLTPDEPQWGHIHTYVQNTHRK